MAHKKKIAVFANGWNTGALNDALNGMSDIAKKEDFDTYIFVSHCSYNGVEYI